MGFSIGQLFKLGIILPSRPKLEGPLSINDRLKDVEYILNGEVNGPESLVVEGDSIYTGLYDGRVVHIKSGKVVKEVRFTKHKNCGSYETEPLCGRPLGIRRLNANEFVVADAYLGIFVVNMMTECLLNRYLPEDCRQQGANRRTLHAVPERCGGMLCEKCTEIRLLKHKISTGKTDVLLDNLNLPNGIQLHPDGNSLLFAECNEARIMRLDLSTNKVTPFATNLPGLPDNIRLGADNTLWVGLAGVRHADALSLVDAAGAYPMIRQVLLDFVPPHWWIKYLEMLRPPHAMILRLNAGGEIIESMHDTTGTHIKDVSQVTQAGDYLYFGSFHNKYIAKLYIGD
ncbi:unnamed protein product [Heligmosomoides polygyrus]|uniref:Str_synth domain-containing protein n=1 Tax=Heligmosomoides polygyrus TaxID=6339 RepID=A0A3P7YLM4_HELPZ|nr:unnamed protein product [Heligmosomoides polygyrus]